MTVSSQFLGVNFFHEPGTPKIKLNCVSQLSFLTTYTTVKNNFSNIYDNDFTSIIDMYFYETFSTLNPI
jgi:hypothetical protein